MALGDLCAVPEPREKVMIVGSGAGLASQTRQQRRGQLPRPLRAELRDWPCALHVGLASLVTCIFGLLLLSVDLLRNCLSEERGPAESINSIVGLGLPLLLTAILASLHLLVPKDTQLNPQVPLLFSSEISSSSQVGEQTQCVVIPQRPLTRFLLLYHLPIFRCTTICPYSGAPSL